MTTNQIIEYMISINHVKSHEELEQMPADERHAFTKAAIGAVRERILDFIEKAGLAGQVQKLSEPNIACYQLLMTSTREVHDRLKQAEIEGMGYVGSENGGLKPGAKIRIAP